MQERQLMAMHPALNATYDAVTNTWQNLNGWTQLAGTVLVHESNIDLSGYAMESLTFFPQAVGLQDPGIYSFKGSDVSPTTGLQVLDIITSVPMDLLEVSNALTQTGAGPGMIGSTHEFETLVFGMYRFFTLNTNVPYLNYQQLERSQRFDSGQPNAADRLFCYRIVTCLTTDLTPESLLNVPAARQLIGGAMDAEPELVYMQRLKRSYELANQV